MKESIKTICRKNILNESAFRIAYFISLFLSGVVFLDIVSIFFCVIIFIWSLFIFKNKLKHKILREVRYSKIIFLFILFSVITAFVNIRMGFPISFLAGLVVIYHSVICFFIFYGMSCESSFNLVKKEIILLCKIFVTISTALVILGFAILLFGDSFSFEFTIPIIDNYEHYYRILGIVKNTNSVRFTGVFINPNILAFSSVVSIIFCHILYRTDQFYFLEKKWTQILLVTLIVSTHFSALVLSDSIASFLFLIIYTVLWLFYKLVLEKNISTIKSIIKHGIIFFFGCVILIFGLFALRFYFQNSASDIIEDFCSIITNTANPREDLYDIHFGRPNYDIRSGSGRRLLLKQAMFIFSKHPILGIGSTNVLDYGDIYFESGAAFSNFHNGYVSILVCNGIIGFVLFIIFLFMLLFNLILFFLKNFNSLKNTVFINLIISLLSYLIFAMFEKTLLSEINFMSVFFWATLGYCTSFFIEGKKIEND